MLIQKSEVVLGENYRNVLASGLTREYKGIDALDNPQNVIEVMNGVFHLADMAEEYMYMICTNTKNMPISFFEVAHGNCSMVMAGAREIFIRALLCGAACIILVHNHPSGIPMPSGDDIAFTERIQSAAGLLGITFCDHIIIGCGSYYSFKEEGRMG